MRIPVNCLLVLASVKGARDARCASNIVLQVAVEEDVDALMAQDLEHPKYVACSPAKKKGWWLA